MFKSLAIERKAQVKAAIFLSCFLLFVECSTAQEAKPLKDLDQVDVEVERLTKFDHDMQLSEESLRSLVLVGVKRDIPRIKVQKTVGAYLYVRITSAQTSELSAACYVSLEARRPVRVLRDKDDAVVGWALASVWDKGAILFGSIDSMASRVRQEISDQLTEFAAEYYRQNP